MDGMDNGNDRFLTGFTGLAGLLFGAHIFNIMSMLTTNH